MFRPRPLISFVSTSKDTGVPGLEDVEALDHRLVDLGPAVDVVRLDGELLLQDRRGAVGLERPDLHLPEALAAEARLAAEGLLGDEAVGARRAGVHLLVDEVVQLQHVHDADGHLLLEGSTGATVVELELAGRRQARLLEDLLDLLSFAPSNAGVLQRMPSSRAARPRWVSRIWPTFIRLGTPSGLSTMSTGVPSGEVRHVLERQTFEMTPLLPWRPAILSPTFRLRLVAT